MLGLPRQSLTAARRGVWCGVDDARGLVAAPWRWVGRSWFARLSYSRPSAGVAWRPPSPVVLATRFHGANQPPQPNL